MHDDSDGWSLECAPSNANGRRSYNAAKYAAQMRVPVALTALKWQKCYLMSLSIELCVPTKQRDISAMCIDIRPRVYNIRGLCSNC